MGLGPGLTQIPSFFYFGFPSFLSNGSSFSITVANIAREQAKEYLRKHQPFVWNATNVTLQMRESLVSLMETYHSHVRIVYLETPWDTLLERNSQREHVVPTKVIEEMLEKLTLPETCEAKTVEWICI